MSDQSLHLAERYLLHSAVARGGMATVWRARDEVLARLVAVKILHPHLSDDEAFLERFRREAYAAARLTHPNIVSIYDTGFDRDEHDGERHYIVMEYCGGGTLVGLAERAGGRLPPESVIEIGIAICDALEYAHAAGIVHRDIKPANVLRSDAGTVKVGDFGIAKAATDAGDITTTGTILGTVTYLSPEQARGDEPDARSDIYSLGIVLYELLVGRAPFKGESQVATALMHVNEAPPPPRSLVPTIPRDLETVIMRSLAKDPADRFGSAGELRDALFALGGRSHTSVLRTPAPAPQEHEHVSRSELRWLWPVLFLVAVAVVSVLVLPGVFEGEEQADGGGAGDQDRQTRGLPIEIVEASSFDPEGDGSEHEEDVGSAFDGDPATAWQTESYSTSFSEQKSGVGLMFDLGSAKEVAGIELQTPTPGFTLEVHAADSLPTDTGQTDMVARASDVSETQTIELDEPTASQYWLLWVTRLPGSDTGSMEISEVRFRGG